MTTPDKSNALNLSAGIASVSVALILVLAKLWALGETGSLSLAASLADSALDLMVSLAGLAAIRYAAKPADDDHAFGHSSAEDLAALAQSLFILMSSGVIAAAALRRLVSTAPSSIQNEGHGIVVLVFSILLTFALVLYQRRVARKTGSKVVAADSLHYVGDLVPSIGAILSLVAARHFGIFQIDSVVALGAAAFLAAGAIRIGKGAWDALMDRAAPRDMIEGIEDITRNHPGVHGFHDLKTRTAGAVVFVNLHIELDGDQTLREAHAIGASLRRKIITTYPQTDVIVHKDVAR